LELVGYQMANNEDVIQNAVNNLLAYGEYLKKERGYKEVDFVDFKNHCAC
jgi:hypothetical protein